MPKISVIIPVYNAEKYLPRCLESVLNQTLPDIEVICINDCSPDNCLSILKEYAQRDSRIKLIDFKENRGAAAARNIGIDEAQGEYIGFVDSDDFVDLDFYEKLYNRAIETDADAVKGTFLCYNNDKEESSLILEHDLNEKIKVNKAYFYFTFTTAIYRRIFIKKNGIKFPEGLVHFEDPCFTVKAALFYNKVEIVENINYYYTDNKHSISRENKNIELVKSLIKGANNIMNILNQYNADRTHYLIVFGFVFSQILEWCHYGEDKEMKSLAAKGLSLILKKCSYENEFLQKHFSLENNISKKDFFLIIKSREKDFSVDRI